MNFEADDLDWAMGELANLFAKSNRVGILPFRISLIPDYFLKLGLFYVFNRLKFQLAAVKH